MQSLYTQLSHKKLFLTQIFVTSVHAFLGGQSTTELSFIATAAALSSTSTSSSSFPSSPPVGQWRHSPTPRPWASSLQNTIKVIPPLSLFSPPPFPLKTKLWKSLQDLRWSSSNLSPTYLPTTNPPTLYLIHTVLMQQCMEILQHIFIRTLIHWVLFSFVNQICWWSSTSSVVCGSKLIPGSQDYRCIVAMFVAYCTCVHTCSYVAIIYPMVCVDCWWGL